MEAVETDAMVKLAIVVPVRNEAAVLGTTVPALLRAAGPDAHIVWVCNGCTDNSAELIRAIAGERGKVIELERPGKSAAFQSADDYLGALFPRVYFDADAWFQPEDISGLLRPLIEGKADLVAPRHGFCPDGVSAVSAAMAECWLALPFASQAAFSCAIAVSEAGRSRWQQWPDITGDDMFVASCIPAERRMIAEDVIAITRPPVGFMGWVRMRRRWRKGERELSALGLKLPTARNQRSALLRRLISPRHAFGAWCFVAARLLAEIPWQGRAGAWLPDRPVHGIGASVR